MTGLLSGGPDLLLKMAAGLLVVWLLVSLVIRVPRAVFILILFNQLLAALYFAPVAMHLGSTTVYFTDLLWACPLVVVLGRVLQNRAALSSASWLILVAVLVIFGLAVIGAVQHSLQSSMNELRGVIQPLPVALYAALVIRTDRDIDWVARLWVWWGLVLTGVAALHWAEHGLGSSSRMIVIGGQVVTSRGLLASGALDVTLAALIVLFTRHPLGWSRAQRVSVGSWLCLVVVLLQHRSLWLALAASCLVGIATVEAQRAGRATALAAGTYVGIVAAVAAAVGGSSISGDFAASWKEAFSSNSTATWRINGWSELIHQQLSQPGQWLFGRPFGFGYARILNHELVLDAPHNYLIQILLRGGVVCVFLVLMAFIAIWRALGNRNPAEVGLRTMLFAAFMYMLAYPLEINQGIIIGLCIAAAFAPNLPAGPEAPGEAIPAPSSVASRQMASRPAARLP